MRQYRGLLFLPFLAVVIVALPLRAGEDELRRRVLELNKITGNDVMRGEIAILIKDAKAKELIQTALTLAKENKNSLAYNAALVFARVADNLKDPKSSEAFYRICTQQAVKLRSTQKLEQSYGNLIMLLFENKQYAESEKVCRELIELRTDDGKDREDLVGETIKKTGEFDYFRDDKFEPAAKLRSGVYRLLIQSVAKQGKFKEALKMVDKLIVEHNHWLERALKGWVQREAGQYADAAKTYEDALTRVRKDKNLEPEDRDFYRDNYSYILSNLYLEEDQLDKATEHLQALLARHPDDPGYNNDLGYIWADHNVKLPEAEKLIVKALEMDRQRRKSLPDITPEENHDNGAYLDSLGWVYFKQKKYKEAKEMLQKAVEDKKSQHIEIYDHLGDVLLTLGEREAAVEAWRKGLELAGDTRRERQRKAAVEKKLQKLKERPTASGGP